MSIIDYTSTQPVAFVAGPLSLLFDNGMLRSIHLGSDELIRRVYVAVRDRFWNTIPGEITDVKIRNRDTSFSLSFSSRHSRNEIDFFWRGTVKGDKYGTVTFAMEGEALSTFQNNRIGICLLHPLSCRNFPCSIESPDGIISKKAFPDLVAPDLLFTNIKNMSCPLPSGLRTVINFDGGVFETEDQRNWTDATYKTFCTPRKLPLPVWIKTGTKIHQSVTIQLDKKVSCPEHAPARPAVISAAKEEFTGRIPTIGVSLAAAQDVSSAVALKLAAAYLSHLRIDVILKMHPVRERFFHAAKIAAQTKLPVELALFFTTDFSVEIIEIHAAFAASPFPVARILILKQKEKVTPAELMHLLRPDVTEIFGNVPVFCGTNGHFVEINRIRPQVSDHTGLCFAATPQCHSTDTAAILENLPGLFETLRTATAFAREQSCCISPLTLRTRKNPEIPEKDGGPDPRQKTQMCAAWILGAIAQCVKGAASSVSCFETHGDAGIMSADGNIYPVYIALSWLAPLCGRPAGFFEASDQVIGVRAGTETTKVLCAANISEKEVSVLITDLPETFLFSMLNGKSFDSIHANGTENHLKAENTISKNGRFELCLPPFAITKIEYDSVCQT